MECQNKNIFPGQKPDEKISLFIRRHWVSFLPTILIAVFMIVLPIVVLIGIIIGLKIDLNPTIYRYITLGASAYILFVLTFFLVGWVDYYFDVLIVTDERLVNIEQNGLFNRHISELDLLRVQNVSTSIKGIISTMLDYGCVTVQTAGEAMGSAADSSSSDFTMASFPHPNDIAQTILRLHQELALKRGQSQAAIFGEGEIHPNSNPSNGANPPEETPASAVPKPAEESEPAQTPEETQSTEDVEPSKSETFFSPIEEDESKPIENSESTPAKDEALPVHKNEEGQLKEGETIDL